VPETKRIRGQLRRAYEGQAWHGPSVRELLDGVTAAKAAARPVPALHTIWEIVLHITAWEKAALRMLAGEAVDLSPAQDWPPVRDPSEAAWQDTLAALATAHAALLDTIANLTDERLDDIVAGRDYSVYFLLHGLTQHALYHAGQIALLKKI